MAPRQALALPRRDNPRPATGCDGAASGLDAASERGRGRARFLPTELPSSRPSSKLRACATQTLARRHAFQACNSAGDGAGSCTAAGAPVFADARTCSVARRSFVGVVLAGTTALSTGTTWPTAFTASSSRMMSTWKSHSLPECGIPATSSRSGSRCRSRCAAQRGSSGAGAEVAAAWRLGGGGGGSGGCSARNTSLENHFSLASSRMGSSSVVELVRRAVRVRWAGAIAVK